MASTYSSNLKIELMGTGENSGTWGTITNTNLGTAMEQAIIGYGNPDYTSDADLTISITNSNASQAARCLVLNVTSVFGSLTQTRNLVVPTSQKQYIVQNNTAGGQSIVVKTSAGTGITVPNGRKAHLYVNGTDVIQMFDFVDINGGAIDGTPIGASSASTGAFTSLSATSVTNSGLTATRVPYASTGGLLVDSANMTFNGTRLTVADLADSGLTSGRVVYASTGGALVDSANLTFDGTTLTANALTTTSTVTINGGTANGVAYLNGSKVLTTGSALTFDGTNFATTGNANLGSGSKSTDTQLNFASDLGTQRIYLDRGTRSLVFYDATTAIENYRIAGITGIQTWGVGGSEQMRLTSTGLGIGTSSPAYKLDIGGTNPRIRINETTGYVLTSYFNTGGSFDVGRDNSAGLISGAAYAGFLNVGGAYPLIFNTNSAERMRLDSSGNLGLGVTPSAWRSNTLGFQVGPSGVSLFSDSGVAAGLGNNMYLNASSQYIYQRTDLASRYQQYQGAHSWYNAPSGTAGNAISFTQAMTLDASGNLGLGTTNPGGSATARQLSLFGTTSQFSATVGAFTVSLGNNATLGYVEVTGANPLAFYTNGAERMRLDSSGNLGIGTTATSNGRLNVNAGTAATGNSLFLQNLDGTINPYLQVQHSSSGVRFVVGNSFSGANNNLIFGSTNTLNGMTLNDSGNLGLGVTPSAWYTGFGAKAFQFAASGSLYGLDVSNGDRRVILGNNFYDNAGGSPTYTNTGAATRYQQVAGEHQWYRAASGTAGNAITFTQAMTLAASGGLSIGTTADAGAKNLLLDAGGKLAGNASSGGTSSTIELYNASTGNMNLTTGFSSAAITFATQSTERARITSGGDLLVGTTAYPGASNTPGVGLNPVGQIAVERDGGIAGVFNRYTSDGSIIIFRRSGTQVGSIDVTTTATSYVTSSDYRLKHDIAPMTGALAKVAALKPVNYKWNVDNSAGEGFIAHELAEVCPAAVTGEKDAVDAEGNPVYQGIDTSFLVATLTAAIQELKAEFDAYKATHP